MRESGVSLRSKVALRSHLIGNRTAHIASNDAPHTRENGRMVGLQPMNVDGQIVTTILVSRFPGNGGG